MQSVSIIIHFTLYFLSKLHILGLARTFLFRQESRARGLAENQDEKYNFLSDIYNLPLRTLKHHINSKLKKSNTKFLLFLSFCNSKTSTMTRNAPRRKNWVFFLKMIFLPWHILSYSKPSICHLNKSHFPHSFKEFERRNIIIFTVTTTLVLYITNFSWSWQGQVTGENEEILLPEPFPGTKISCQVNLLDVTPTMVMVILFREEEEVMDM